MKCSRWQGLLLAQSRSRGGERELAGNYFLFGEHSGMDGAARSKRGPLGLSPRRGGGGGCGRPRGGDSRAVGSA